MLWILEQLSNNMVYVKIPLPFLMEAEFCCYFTKAVDIFLNDRRIFGCLLTEKENTDILFIVFHKYTKIRFYGRCSVCQKRKDDIS